MDTQEPVPDASAQPTPIPVRVPMSQFFSALKELLTAPGPFVSFYLPVHDSDARAASLVAVASAGDLSTSQQDFGRSLLETERVADDAMIVGLRAADGTSFVQSFPEGPDAPLVELAPLPRLASVVEAEQRLRHHLLAVVSADGIDVLTFPRHGRATLHRASAGDPAYTALLITEAAKQSETPLVLIAADHELAVDLVRRVSIEVPIETRVQIVDVDAGIDAIADRTVQSVATDRAEAAVRRIRGWKFERSHGLTSGGIQAAIQTLRGDDIRLVLVTDVVDDQRQAWFGLAATAVAMDLEDASTIDDLGEDLVPARLIDVVLRSALLRDVPVTVVPDLPDETLRDGVGVVRTVAQP